MENSYINIISKKSDTKLKKIVLNPNDYQLEFVECAKAELKNRNIELSEQELLELELKKKEDLENINDNQKFSGFCISKDKNIVDDISAPELYSKNHILIFSLLFTFIFSGTLFSYNLIKLRKNKEAILIYLALIAVGVVTTLFSINYALSEINSPGRLRIHYAILVHIFINTFFVNSIWWNFIGKNLKYRSKALSIPIVIAAVLILIIAYFIYTQYIR